MRKFFQVLMICRYGMVVGFRVNNAYLLCDFEQESQHFWQYRIIPNEMPTGFSKLRLPHALNRNLDHNWQLELSEQALAATAISEEGICAQATLQGPFALTRQADSNAQHIRDAFSKLGNTPYRGTDQPCCQPGLVCTRITVESSVARNH